MAKRLRLFAVVLLLGLYGCGEAVLSEGDVCPEPEVVSFQEALSTIDCSATTDDGYTDGKRFTITVVTIDGKKVEQETANAYYVMAQAASADGVEIRIVSGFRTMASQESLYACYVNCNCNNCNLAAKPGYSNHQSGHALDLNTSAARVLDWLNAHGAAYGFKRTVPSEAWHWEWWGGGPGGGPCRAAGDAAIDGKSMSSNRDAGTSDGGGASEGEESGDPRTTEADGAGVGDEGRGDDDSVGHGGGAGAQAVSASSPKIMSSDAPSLEAGCSCRIGAGKSREAGARLAAAMALAAILFARRYFRYENAFRRLT